MCDGSKDEHDGRLPISVIMPTLNAAGSLALAIGSVKEHAREIIVADGGSSDETRAIAATNAARTLTAAQGRGSQMAAGAAVASQEWLLFLHADTRLGDGWQDKVRQFIATERSGSTAACFQFGLDDRARAARRMEFLVHWRTRLLGLPYGDQGLLIHNSLYMNLGGFRPIPLMEDVDLVRRIGRRRIEILNCAAITSAVRYQRDGYLMRPLRNLVLLGLFFLGARPQWLAKVYG
jgi:rSAM/selenodomain-associated transferase 2